MELTILFFLLNTLMVLGTEAINNGNVTKENLNRRLKATTVISFNNHKPASFSITV